MWEDKFCFVAAALITALTCLLHDAWSQAPIQPAVPPPDGIWPRLRKRILGPPPVVPPNPQLWKRPACILLGLVAFGSLVAAHGWKKWSWPSIGTVLILGMGLLFGLFTSLMIRILLRGESPVRALWPGALALLTLSVGYSLPVYQDEIEELLRNSGISHVKVAMMSVEFETDLASKDGSGAVSAAGGPTGSTADMVAHPNDPGPGIELLYQDFGRDDGRGRYQVTQADIDYVTSLRGAPDARAAKDDLKALDQMLEPLSILADCLHKVKPEIRDAQLLATDTNSVRSTLFRLHRESIQRMQAIAEKPQDYFPPISTDDLRLTADTAVERVLDTWGEQSSKVRESPVLLVKASIAPDSDKPRDECQKRSSPVISATYEEPAKPYSQIDPDSPYLTLALADVSIADGEPDQAVDVLADWLSQWDKLNKPTDLHNPTDLRNPTDLERWYAIRVMSRLVNYMEEISGRNNRAYRYALARYQTMFSGYVADSLPQFRLSLDQLDAAKCKELAKAADQPAGTGDLPRRLALILIGTEKDALATELGFVSEETQFDRLDKLYERAERLAGFSSECLPERDIANKLGAIFAPEYRKATIYSGQIIAGAISLAAGERMERLASSIDERNRADKARRQGLEWAHSGWRDLQDIWVKDIDPEKDKDGQEKGWHDRIFTGSPWEEAATLAMRIEARGD